MSLGDPQVIAFPIDLVTVKSQKSRPLGQVQGRTPKLLTMPNFIAFFQVMTVTQFLMVTPRKCSKSHRNHSALDQAVGNLQRFQCINSE